MPPTLQEDHLSRRVLQRQEYDSGNIRSISTRQLKSGPQLDFGQYIHVPLINNAVAGRGKHLFGGLLQRQRVQEPDPGEQLPEKVPPDGSEGTEEEDGVLLHRATLLRAEGNHQILQIPHETSSTEVGVCEEPLRIEKSHSNRLFVHTRRNTRNTCFELQKANKNVLVGILEGELKSKY